MAKANSKVSVDSWESSNVLVQDALDNLLVSVAKHSVSLRKLDTLRLNDLLVSLQIRCVVLQELFEVFDGSSLVTELMIETAQVIAAGNLVHDEVSVLVNVVKSLLVLALSFYCSDCHQYNLASFVSLHFRLSTLLIELEYAFNALNAAAPVSIDIAGCGQGDPIRHDARLCYQHFSACVFKAGEIAQVDLQLIEFARCVLSLWVTL